MLDLTFLVSLFFLEFWFSLPRLGQTSVRSTPKAAPSLESKGSKGASCSSLLCFFFFFFFFFNALPLPLPSMAKLPVSLPSFSYFAKVSSPFLQRVVCSLAESSKKSKEREDETPLQEVDTSSPAFFSSFFFSFFFFLFTFLPRLLSPF